VALDQAAQSISYLGSSASLHGDALTAHGAGVILYSLYDSGGRCHYGGPRGDFLRGGLRAVGVSGPSVVGTDTWMRQSEIVCADERSRPWEHAADSHLQSPRARFETAAYSPLSLDSLQCYPSPDWICLCLVKAHVLASGCSCCLDGAVARRKNASKLVLGRTYLCSCTEILCNNQSKN
jgi:hypothetical protein